jgi:hypothetical protein
MSESRKPAYGIEPVGSLNSVHTSSQAEQENIGLWLWLEGYFEPKAVQMKARA